MSVSADPRIGTELAGYRIEELLGRGGMSVVYLAEQLALKRKVALKLLAPELAEDERFRERFLRESELAASLDHPNVIPIHDAGEAEGLLYLAMRYVEGTDLRKRLDAEGRLEPKTALSLLSPVADALDAAHARGLVHRDVKPGNILLAKSDAGEHVYLSDFGLTKRTREEGSLTETGQFVGTIDYVAPEQIEGQGIDGRADVYSLGCVLYECLTGEVPYQSDSKMGVLWSHLQAEPPKASEQDPELPTQLDPVIAKALAKEPEERYESCRALAEEARSALALGEELVVPSAAQPRSRRRLVFVVLLAALVLAAAAVPSILLTRSEGEVELAADSLARIESASNELATAIGVGQKPRSVAVGEGAVWVANFESQTVSRIDSETNAVTETVGVRGAPTDVGTGQGAAWVTSSLAGDGTLTQLDSGTGRAQRALDVGYSDPKALTVGEGAVWVAAQDIDGSAVLRILPASGEVTATIPLPGQPFDIAVGEDAVWVIAGLLPGVTQTGQTVVVRIDPETNEVVQTIELGDTAQQFAAVAVGGGAVWASVDVSGTLSRIDPATNSLVGTVDVGAPAEGLFDHGIAVGAGSVWITSHFDATLRRVDPVSGEVVETIVLGAPKGESMPLAPTDVVVGIAGAVWVTVATPT